MSSYKTNSDYIFIYSIWL